jgi:hypothetical protein
VVSVASVVIGIPSLTGENPILINHPVGQQVPSAAAADRA